MPSASNLYPECHLPAPLLLAQAVLPVCCLHGSFTRGERTHRMTPFCSNHSWSLTPALASSKTGSKEGTRLSSLDKATATLFSLLME